MEQLAGEYLKGKGYRILEINFYSRFGEIDIIAMDGDYLVFLEVKYRKSASAGYPAEAVGKEKQERIYRAAQYYLYKRGLPSDTPCRFDVAAIRGDEITLIKNAFGGL